MEIDKRRVWQLPFHTCVPFRSKRHAMTASFSISFPSLGLDGIVSGNAF